MATITSRPVISRASHQDLMAAAEPAIDILTLISTLIVFFDDTPKSVQEGYDLVEEALECLKYPHFVVMSSPSVFPYELVYDVAVQPLVGSTYVSFKVIFKVRP